MTQHYWHPFADMSAVPPTAEVVIAGGQEVTVWDESGRRYLDATASLWYCAVGYGRSQLADAAAAQMRSLAAFHTFGVYANRPALELADRLASLSPLPGQTSVFLTSGGSDSVETAAKLARRYWEVAGAPQRTVVIARRGAYHGMSGFGTSFAGIAPNHDGWGPLLPDVVHVEAHDPVALADALGRHAGRVAAVIGEPVIGAGGVYPPPAGYWPEVERLVRADGALLIADEVVTGYGRLGRWFGCQRYGFTPDMVTTAKALTSGYLPLGAVLIGERVREVLWAPGAGQVRHGYTYSGHPAGCAVALANLALLEDEQLVSRAADLEPGFQAAVATLAGEPLVGEVRGVGLMAAVALDPAAVAAEPGLADRLVALARDTGVLTRNLLGSSLQLSPPFVVTPAEIDRIVAGLRDSLRTAATTGPQAGLAAAAR